MARRIQIGYYTKLQNVVHLAISVLISSETAPASRIFGGILIFRLMHSGRKKFSEEGTRVFSLPCTTLLYISLPYISLAYLADLS